MTRSVSFNAGPRRWIVAWLVLTACGLRGIDQDLTKEPPESHEGLGGQGGAKARSTGGNGLERPPGSSGRDAASGGAVMAPTMGDGSGGASGEGGVSPPTGAMPATAGKPSVSAGRGGSNGEGATDDGGAETNAGTAGTIELGGGGGDTAPEPPAPPMFFSEYVEGDSNNKALEITATSDGSMDGCVIEIYLNAAVSPSRTVVLAGQLAGGVPYVVCDEKFAEPWRCHAKGTLSFNGNDVVDLVCRGELMDVIGRLGEAPKERWGTAALGTLDLTLRRNCDVREGDRDLTDAYDPALEWSAAGKNAFDGLGTHCAEMSGAAGADAGGSNG